MTQKWGKKEVKNNTKIFGQSNWQNELSLIKIGNVAQVAWCEEQCKELILKIFKFQVAIRHPNGDVKQAVGYTNLEFKREVQAGIISIYDV